MELGLQKVGLCGQMGKHAEWGLFENQNLLEILNVQASMFSCLCGHLRGLAYGVGTG